ncbi:SGNH/GDSL hydrolase family protein [Patescibacteria group bacterium]|nr:SGNH/GDSL hydrolase family protein [Patescibacteria group bacterium]MBU1868583.1 SGNH/GDSL hydrolase family protein [Patescibacteria group bacterium]
MKLNLLEEISKNLTNTGKYWIVFTGDSITSCEWVHPNWRDIVIYVLQEEMTTSLNGDWQTSEWGIKGFNFAYDGATTRDILEKINDILLVKPQLVIGMMGGSDPVLDVGIEESIENIKKISELIANMDSKLIWCNSTPAGKGSKMNPEYEPYARAFMQIPDKKDFFKIDMFNLYQKFPTEKFFTFLSEENPVEGIKAGEPDLQHPNQLGNAYIAKIILKEAFGIEFDPENYIRDTREGKKYPSY